MSSFEKFFAKKNVMFVSFLIAVIFYAFRIAVASTSVCYNGAAIFIVMATCLMLGIVIALYRSYVKHEVNALNILTGAIITSYIVLEMFKIYASVTSDAIDNPLQNVSLVITSVILIIPMIILFINHIQINSIHKSTRKRILLNQVLLIFLAAYQVYIIVCSLAIPVYVSSAAGFNLVPLVDGVAKIFLFFMIICIETRLNAYKLERESSASQGIWTDEKKDETKKKYFGK